MLLQSKLVRSRFEVRHTYTVNLLYYVLDDHCYGQSVVLTKQICLHNILKENRSGACVEAESSNSGLSLFTILFIGGLTLRDNLV